MAAKAPQIQVADQNAPSESFSFGFKDSAVVNGAAGVATVGAIGAGAYFAGTTAAQFLPSGNGGVMGAISGALLGGLTGGAAGIGLGTLSTKLDPSDSAGDAMMSGFTMVGGAAVGVVSGAIAGYFGAQPLIVAPATVAGAGAGAFASAAALSLLD